jgi:hypothetical protein|tara:strand:+ start:2999 stop:3196 length:198 start_codon:yes stop_codon:yes gene_type:complete
MNQVQQIYRHLETGKSISGYEARDLYRIASLPRRINDLEEQGFKIERSRRTDPTGRRYVRYSLSK